MHCDASDFSQRIKDIKAAVRRLDKGAASLLRDTTLLRRELSGGRHAERRFLEAVDAAAVRMMLSHDMLRKAVGTCPPSSGNGVRTPGPAPSGTLPDIPQSSPLDALYDAATTLAIIRNAMGILAGDSGETTRLAPWRRELFIQSYERIAAVVEALHEAYKALLLEKDSTRGEPDGR